LRRPARAFVVDRKYGPWVQGLADDVRVRLTWAP
jgi:hypothetical protein